MKLKFLHTNDFHGRLDDAILAQLKELRADCDFYFDSGDAIKTGNLGVPLSRDPVWDAFRLLDCTASVLGNRETHPIRLAFDKKIEGHGHPILAGNMATKDGSDYLPKTLILEKEGFKVGVVSTMVAMATSSMKTSGAWSFLWSSPIETAVKLATELRPQVDLLIALTHIGFAQDQALARRCRDLDIIFGGHSHTVLPQPIQENQTWIAQGGSHGRYAGVYEWDNGALTGELVPLNRSGSRS